MMNFRQSISVLSIALLFVTAGSQMVRSEKSKQDRKYTVVVVSRDMKKGSRLTADCVRCVKVDWLPTARPISSISKAVGLVVDYNLYRGQAVSELDIGAPANGDEIRAVWVDKEIPQGTRITKEQVRTAWQSIGKGSPEGPQLEESQVIGRVARERLIYNTAIEEIELEPSAVSPAQ